MTIQAHVHRMNADGASATAAAHLRYIERIDGGPDGAPATLYGPDGPVSREDFQKPQPGEQHQFRFVVSPEDAREVDLHDYVRRLMQRVERELGRSLEWVAANHFDTDHPHAHIVVRGVDLEGRRVRLSRQYISHGMRWTAQELATELLGPRLESEIQRTREREVVQERLTSLDREIERCASGSRVDADSIRARRGGGREGEHLLNRLEHLERLGVAERVSPGSWELAPGWQKHLRELGERGDILKQIHRAMRGGDPGRFHAVRPGQGLPDGRGGIEERVLVGRVAGKGLEDESKGIWYAVLETPTGAAYHVRLTARQAEVTRTGDLVTFGTEREPAVRPVDRRIAEEASRRGGIYKLPGDGGQDEGARSVTPRLRELERLGLVASRTPGEWNVPADLLRQLERHEQQAPTRNRLSLRPLGCSLEEQAFHRGAVWLDTMEPKDLACEGFGAEVRAALERRGEVLRELGIAPEDPQRVSKLRDLEQRTTGRDRARQTGESFVERLSGSFQGRVQPAREGAAYFAVSDGKRFVLVPDSREARSSVGRDVDIRLDANARVVIHTDGPARAAAREDLARRAIGEQLARQTRETFLPTVPDGFRGRVSSEPSAAPYLTVSDGTRFVLVPVTPEAHDLALRGSTVHVVRDANGRVVGLRLDRDLGRGR
ncbi:MAG TPA: DUF3363 domain-containing protein [Polyangiaceae bacterium]|nr:DUF3363 domain-containing protein [Polyangiaceae bacterium]